MSSPESPALLLLLAGLAIASCNSPNRQQQSHRDSPDAERSSRPKSAEALPGEIGSLKPGTSRDLPIRELDCTCDKERARMHPGGRYGFAKCENAEGDFTKLIICDFSPASRSTLIELGASLTLQATFEWIPQSTNILVWWTAGSDSSFANVYDIQGKKILDAQAVAITLGPESRYLIAYTPVGGPLAAPAEANVFALGTGKTLWHADDCRVQGIRWHSNSMAFSCAGGAKTQTVTVRLWRKE
jgi:hypothetical protein